MIRKNYLTERVEIDLYEEDDDELTLDINNVELMEEDECQLMFETKKNRILIKKFMQE